MTNRPAWFHGQELFPSTPNFSPFPVDAGAVAGTANCREGDGRGDPQKLHSGAHRDGQGARGAWSS